jgi:hypothetical protein
MPNPANWNAKTRVILYHKHRTSARTLFLRRADGSLMAPVPLPPLSSVLGDGEDIDDKDVSQSLAPVLEAVARHLNLPIDLLSGDPEFFESVDTPEGPVAIYLAHFTSINPPLDLASTQGASFCPLTDFRGSHPAELELARRAYKSILG